jgi:hypothetical protein
LGRPVTRSVSRRPVVCVAAVMLLCLALSCASALSAQESPPSEFQGTLFRGVSLGDSSFAPSVAAAAPWFAPVGTASLDRAALLGAAIDPEFRQTSTGGPATVAPPPPRRFWLAAGEIVLLEGLPWVFNRYIADEDFARISWDTVEANYKAGFGFDNDHFSTNQSAHPLHGSLFFNAGRSNGYSYWESALFTAMGSVIWEMTMENTRPSVNDLVNTTLGGMTRGEVSHRLAAVIRDNMASGSERFWRELGATVLDPVGTLTRLVNGDLTRDFPNPEERYPDGFSLTSDVGYRHVGGAPEHPDQAIVTLSAYYGDPFTGDIAKPFDSFWAGIDINFPVVDTAISRIEERGILKGWELTDRSSSARHIFGFTQEYEYFNNRAQVFGAQVLGAGLLSRYRMGKSLVLVTDFSLLGVPLAGIKTTNFINPETGRNYDYAPGGGGRTAFRLYAGPHEILSVGYGVIWATTVNGISDFNTLQFFRANGRVPIVDGLAAGGGHSWYSRKTTYTGFFERRETQSEWRAFLSFTFGRSGLRKPHV